jgi:hypothetical protein
MSQEEKGTSWKDERELFEKWITGSDDIPEKSLEEWLFSRAQECSLHTLPGMISNLGLHKLAANADALLREFHLSIEDERTSAKFDAFAISDVEFSCSRELGVGRGS